MEPHQQVDQDGLTDPVGAFDAYQLAWLDGKIQTIQNRNQAAIFTQFIFTRVSPARA